MAQTVCVVVSTAEREQLAAIAGDRNRPRKHVERVRIVLASADRHSPQRVAHSIGVSRPTVWRWQQRFAESGVEGLLRDKSRKPPKAGLGSWLSFYNEQRPHQSLGYRTPRQAYEAECRWIWGRSASPTGCALAHIPTGTTANHRIGIDEGEGRSNVMSVAPSAIGAGTEIGRATP